MHLLFSTCYMRLFVALDIENEIRERLQNFVEEIRLFAPKARWVSPESLHVTLKFIGERPDSEVKDIVSALHNVSAEQFKVAFRGCGFFPSSKAARVFWVGIEAGPDLHALANSVETALEPLGIAKEKRAFSPHLTLARSREGSGAPGWRKGDQPNKQFEGVQKRLSESNPLEFGTMTAPSFFLYQSQLSSKGARYTKLERFVLQPKSEQE